MWKIMKIKGMVLCVSSNHLKDIEHIMIVIYLEWKSIRIDSC